MLGRIVVASIVLALAAGCAPAASQAGSPFPCNDAQFLADQRAFAAHALRSDQFEDICGLVSAVLPAARTRSGTHGYFYVRVPPAQRPIEIVANLDAMAEAATGDPPAIWPWVSAGQYVYVQGRYYYDSAARQGVDWTENDSSRSWPHVGYVAVCDPAGAACNKYW